MSGGTGTAEGRTVAAPGRRDGCRCPSCASIPTCRCPATPTPATPVPTWWPASRSCSSPTAVGPWCPTGIALALPEGYAGFVQPRSGLALRHGVTCLNTPGLIDSGYRDELAVLLVNTDPEVPYRVQRGDRIAQLVIQRVETADFVEVDSLAGVRAGPRRLRVDGAVSAWPG